MKSIDFAIMIVESGGDLNAIGDRHLDYMAYGPMQIRQPACLDVNRRYGTSFDARDLLGRMSVSLAIFWLYMSIYATSDRLGRMPTDEDRARIHNGGPDGWRNPNTLEYWRKVKAEMERP
jgi:hypothetical protein